MSGKQSKKVRKEKKLSKKVVAGAAAAIIGSAPVVAEGGEFLISVFPHFSFPVVKFDNSLSTGFGGGLQLTYRPNPYFNIFLQGDYKQYTFDTKQSISNLSIMGGTVGGGYHLPVTDRLGIDFNAGIGYYLSNYSHGTGSNKTTSSLQGLSVGGGIFVSYKINPTLSVMAGPSANHYAYKNSKFVTSVDITPGLTVNLTKAFSNKTNVSVSQDELKPVFPVFYSWYNDNPFGSVDVTNNEDVTITDVNVYFFQPQYMTQPKECGKMAKLKSGVSFSVDLRAFFNEQMLELNEKNDTMSTIIVEYKYLGKKESASFPMVVPVYGRNNMSWEDDRCASAFVSSKDPAAMWFAKYVVSAIRENIRSGLKTNIQYAMGIFDALDQFGINYVKDPTSAFEDNVGTASIDFLQFPYQTLMYRGGDCDDLSILVCSLLESVGIKTAFITIPGHIFMAFDSGFTVEEAQKYFLTLDEFIVDGDEVWVPLEITLTDEGFNKAWHKGAWEWNTANRSGNAMLYKMQDSWKVYKPVNVPGAVARFSLPEETYVARLFTHSVDEFIIGQIMPQIAWYENRIAMNPTAQNYNDFGVLYARYGLFEQAEKQFRLARNLEYLPSVLNTANLYYSMKDYSRATNWYKEVLASDGANTLAMIGLARCAYEEGNYKECDHWYGTVFNSDRELARKYSYLGAFESTAGRSFSLADRLENTIWITGSSKAVEVETKSSDVNTQIATQTTDVVVKMPKPEVPAETLEVPTPAVALAPVSAEEKEQELEEEKLEGGAGDGDGDDGLITDEELAQAETLEDRPLTPELDTPVITELDSPVIPVLDTGISNEVASTDLRVEPEDDNKVAEADNKVAEVENKVAEVDNKVAEADLKVAEILEENAPVTEEPAEPEVYVGISQQLDISFISVEDLLALAEESIIEHGESIDDIQLTVDESVDYTAYIEENEKAVAEAPVTLKSETPVIPASESSIIAASKSSVIAASESSVIPAADTSVIPVLDTGISQSPDVESPVSENTPNTEIAQNTDLEIPVPEIIPQPELAVNEETAVAETEVAAEEKSESSETIERKPETSTTSVTTDVPLRAVPRFTVQPSAEWAPESAYTAETIPGMKPFEEEMGNYQNEKAFLYKDEEYSFAVNPGEEIKEEEKADSTQLASLEVNPFSSFLTEKEAAKVEAITNFKVEEEKVAAIPVAATSDDTSAKVAASVSSDDIPQPEVIPQPSIAGTEETAVAVPQIEKSEPTTSVVESVETTKKSHGKLIGIIAGIAAAISAVFIAKQRKEK